MPKAGKRRKREEPPETLKGRKAIGDYIGIGAAVAQRWANSGMPVKRQGRFTEADATEIRQWLGREAYMPAPAHVLTNEADISAALKESISAVRRQKRVPTSRRDRAVTTQRTAAAASQKRAQARAESATNASRRIRGPRPRILLPKRNAKPATCHTTSLT